MPDWILHTVLIPKDKYTLNEAKKYIIDHFKYIKYRTAKYFYRFLQNEATKNAIYFTKVLNNGIELVFFKNL